MSELTTHFTWAEAARSQAAVHLGIDNTIPSALKSNVQRVADAMETVRSLLGGNPLKVNSWYRCPALNAAIGGSPKSAHMQGLAVDFEAPAGMSNERAFRLIAGSDIQMDQLIHERTKSGADWIHFGLSTGTLRNQVLVASGSTLGGPMTFTRVALG